MYQNKTHEYILLVKQNIIDNTEVPYNPFTLHLFLVPAPPKWFIVYPSKLFSRQLYVLMYLCILPDLFAHIYIHVTTEILFLCVF